MRTKTLKFHASAPQTFSSKTGFFHRNTIQRALDMRIRTHIHTDPSLSSSLSPHARVVVFTRVAGHAIKERGSDRNRQKKEKKETRPFWNSKNGLIPRTRAGARTKAQVKKRRGMHARESFFSIGIWAKVINSHAFSRSRRRW